MADNLLDKASILLTPTAYNDGRMLSVKPEVAFGSELVTSFTNGTSYPLDTFVSSGNNITSLIKSNGFGGCVSNGSSYTANDKVIVSFTYTKNSGDNLRVLFSSVVTGAGVSVSNNINISESGDYTLYFTILSTTTAYLQLGTGSGSASINGSITNVSAKKDLSGDFTFSRSSAATRVNAQGLVENVQIISSELVSNGNFSQIGTEEVSNGNFSQEGSELVTNGDFATDSDWTKNSGWSIADGKAICNGVGVNSLQQSGVTTTGKTYKLTFDVLSSNDFDFIIISTNFGDTYIDADIDGVSLGTNTFYITPTNGTGIRFRVGDGTTLSIDNVSVKEVGQDWSLESGWSIGDGSLVANSVTTGLAFQSNIVEANKSYKATYSVVVTSGSVGLYFDGGTGYQGVVTTTQTITVFFKATTTSPLYFRSNTSNFTGSITNISVKEVGQDWSLVGTAAIGNNLATINSPSGENAEIYQSSVLTIGRKYKLECILNKTSGDTQFVNGGTFILDNGSNIIEFIATDTRVYFKRGAGSVISSITNISVKEITDDTDLPRINYEGFSYQDSLGSEEVVNGDFSNGSANWGNYTSGSSTIVFTDVATLNVDASNSNVGIYQENVFASGKQYKVVLRIKASSSFDAEVLETQGAVTISTIGSVSLTTSYQDFTFYFTGTGTNDIFIHRKFSSPSANQSITIDNVSVKEYLGQEVVPDSGCGSWLLEGQSTNLITYSSDLSSLNSRSNAVVTSNEVISPSGDLDADKITFDGTYSGRVEQTIAATVGQPYTISVYLKNKDLSDVTQVWIGFSTAAQGQFITITDEWQRYDITTNADGTSEYPRIQFSGTGSLYAWGFQVEQQSYATSYIPTNGATNTRLQDIADNSGNSTLINSTEGVLYAEIAALADDGTSRYISINDDSTSNIVSISFFNNSTINARIVIAGATTYLSSGTITQTDFSKVAIKYKLNDYALWINGVEVDSNNSLGVFATNTLTRLDYGRWVANPFYGKNKALAVYKEALTDSNLRSLTYPNPVATTFDLDFDTIAEQFTFTRGSEATFVNAQGLIESTASNDAPRIDYSTGAKAFLLENQSTNLITQSNLLAAISGGIVTPNAAISPDSTINAIKVNFGTGSNSGGTIYVGGSSASASTEYTISFYAKNFSGDGTFRLRLDTDTQTALVNETFVATSEWVRYTHTFTTDAAAASFSASSRFRKSTTTDNNEVLFFGIQLEQQSYSTSYIPTSGASATRNQELCVDATPVINSEEGTLYAEISALDDSSISIGICDGSTDNRVLILLGSNNTIRGFVESSDTIVFDEIHQVSSTLDYHKVAIKYKANEFALWIDGVERDIDISGASPIGLNELLFNNGGGSANFFGNTKGLKYYPKALADVQLEDLTTI